MTVRVVEGKKPYTGGTAIEITEDKVINLLLREANNLLQVNGNNELFCDLQLNDELRPTDDFPVGITTGRIIEDNGWDWDGTILCAKTTSGDNIKLIYTDAGEIWVDNGTGTFKQMYLASEVDSLLALKQDLLTAGDGISIDSNNEISNTLPGAVVSDTAPTDPNQGDMWYDTTSDELKTYDGSQWNTAGGGGGGGGGGATVSTTEPVNPTTGLIWYNPTTLNLRLYDGTNWVSFGTGEVIRILPSEYQEVEYIQSTGTQYIDTGIQVGAGFSVEAKMMSNATSNEDVLFGTTYGTWDYAQPLVMYYSMIRAGSGGHDVSFSGIGVNVDLDILFDYTKVVVNGTTKTYSGGYSGTYNCTICKGSGHMGKVKIMSFKIYDSGLLVRDYVPCYRIADDEIGLYDRVTDTFYTNDGTGTFNKGNDVN